MDNIPKTGLDVTELQQLRAQGLSYRSIAKHLHSNYSAVRRALTAVPANGDQSSTSLQRREYVGEPVRPSPPIAVYRDPAMAEDIQELKAKVATLEAFMAAVQAEHRHASPSIAAPPIAMHRSESIQWVSRGFQIATDMLARIEAYAKAHRLEKREVVDLALRRFFAVVDREGLRDV